MSFWDRPLVPFDPELQTPEQAALIALFDRLREIEDLAAIEKQVRISMETELLQRVEALQLKVAVLQNRVKALEAGK